MSCKEKNILQREGSSHLHRVLAALSPGYAMPDERDAADLLLFARRYATCLNYYKTDDTPDGDWEALMKMDLSVILATLLKTDVKTISEYQKLLYKKIQSSGSEADAKISFRFLFDLVFSVVKAIDDQFRLLPGDLEFKLVFKNIIEVKLQEAFLKIHSLFDQFKTAGWIDAGWPGLDSDAPLPVTHAANFVINGLSEEWRTITPGTTITLPAHPDIVDNINHVIQHNLFNAQLEMLWKGIAEIVRHASELFEHTLTSFPSHTPHYALYIAFVKIFRHAQDHLNGYTKRHLDFYYKDVLRFVNKPAQPDRAHVLLELQKPIAQHLLQKETLFKGGRDITGKEITYALTDDIVINKALVAAIQSQQLIPSTGKLKASPVSASDDGRGAEIKSIDKSWLTFGDNNKAGFAKTGFAIASNLFFLKEGTRTVFVTVRFQHKLPMLKHDARTAYKFFNARLTGAKGWHLVAPVDLFMLASDQKVVDSFIFRIRISPDDPAIIPYTESIHKENFGEGLPVLQLLWQQDADDAIPYTWLHNKKIKSISITVSVNGVKDLALFNDKGAVDASTPFKPFGDFPDHETSFYIGSKEIFQKDLDWVGINPEWEIRNGPGETKPALFNARYLNQSNWTNAYPISNNRISFTPGSFLKTKIDFGENEPLKSNSLEGFLRLQLNSEAYSLKSHMNKINTQLNSITLTESDNGKVMSFNASVAPPVPADIVINEFSVDYAASATISFTASDATNNNLFYHLTPFGYAEVHPRLVVEADDIEATEKNTLVPHVIHDGALFIGFEQAAPLLVVNVLFQVADGSSNPLKNMEPVSWYYLSTHNNWRRFEKQFVVDRTNNFTRSGIVTLTLPGDIDNHITAHQQGIHWIKAVVARNCDAVCKMISIQAQAALITLVQDSAKQVEFREVRPAASISKLVTADAAIKKISQPFNSFDGRAKESDDHFYVRVSERLRHKQRAITIWDYEHIILEEFPQVFKVRCLNHSGFYFQGDEEVFCENYPGHVTIITIPDQKSQAHVDPLRPYTPIGLLQNINDYLAKIISPFVKLHVKNPAFEEIQLDFKVKFYDHLDESFYLQLLNREIECFLCPWAYDTNAEISFGGKMRKSAVLNFVEERPYVDYVTCFKMHQVISRTGSVHTKEKRDIEVAEGTTSRSLLVSYYDEQSGVKHLIQSPATCLCHG